MLNMFFAAQESSGSGISALGISPSAFVIQFITFVFVFILLKRYAFKPIIKLLDERRKVIDDGVKLGAKMEKEKAKLDEMVNQAMREARADADKIIAGANKEAREIIREAEKTAQRKTNIMLADAETRIDEEAKQAKRRLEKEIVGLVSEATEAIVGEKVNAKKDAKIIDKILKATK